jgi:hypothetical protein
VAFVNVSRLHRRLPRLRSLAPRRKDIEWLVLRKRPIQAQPGASLPSDSDQSVVRTSQIAQRIQPLVVGARSPLAPATFVPSSDGALRPLAGDVVGCHPRVSGATDQSATRQRTVLPLGGVSRREASHRRAHAAPCHLYMGPDGTVKGSDSEAARPRGYVSSKEWRRTRNYSCHEFGY